jgi:hypothetical protein
MGKVPVNAEPVHPDELCKCTVYGIGAHAKCGELLHASPNGKDLTR